MSVQGDAEVREALKGVRRSVTARILKSAVAYAIKPLVPATRAAAPSAFGVLKRSIKSRVKRYTRGGPDKAVVVALVGPESKFKETTHPGGIAGNKAVIQKPSKYAHLVEHGTKAHFVPSPGFGRKAQKQAGAKSRAGGTPGFQHPGAKAQPFIKPTAESSAGMVTERFREQVFKRIKAEFARYTAGKLKRYWSTDR